MVGPQGMDNEGEPQQSGSDSGHGVAFEFHDGDRRIALVVSGYSGREQLYVGDECIVNELQWSTTSTHHFELDGDAYTVTLNTQSFPRVQLSCVLRKHGVIVARQRAIRAATPKPVQYWIAFACWCAVGFALGASEPLGWFAAVALLLLFTFLNRKKQRAIFVVEDVPLDSPAVSADRIGTLRAQGSWQRTLLRLSRNLRAGVKLAIGIRLERQDLQPRALQLIALVLIAFAVPLLVDFFAHRHPESFCIGRRRITQRPISC